MCLECHEGLSREHYDGGGGGERQQEQREKCHESGCFRSHFQGLHFNSEGEVENWPQSIKQQFLPPLSQPLLSNALLGLKVFAEPLVDFLIN